MHLWSHNSPAKFWRLPAHSVPVSEQMMQVVRESARVLPTQVQYPGHEVDSILAQTLGEAQFGEGRWRLSLAKRLYYEVKPIVPRTASRFLRRLGAASARGAFQLNWPVEDRYARFQWEVIRNLLALTGREALSFVHFWPEGHRYALVLTHDIETQQGQACAWEVADLEQSLGFRSSFNFVPERYPIDRGLMEELRARGFEIGVHGLKHDGRLFASHGEFSRRAKRINHYLKEFGAVGFRSPLTHRHPAWMQELEIEYDSSFFDTDPYEPIPGGTMSVWPFFLGHFVELPYTLPQDYTLTAVLGEKTPRIWLEKVDFLEHHHGMALLITHPDYLKSPRAWQMYSDFLHAMKQRDGYWHALPREVAAWWRARAEASCPENLPGAVAAIARLEDGRVAIEIAAELLEASVA